MLNETLQLHNRGSTCDSQRLQIVRAQERRLRRERRESRSMPRHIHGWSVRMF